MLIRSALLLGPLVTSGALATGAEIDLRTVRGTGVVEFSAEAVRPLAFRDGRLLRPLAPAAPVEEDLFYEPGQGRLLRVMAPLPNRSAAIVVYNLDGGVGENEDTLHCSLTTDLYQQASGMIQPYPGRWRLPAEGLLVYDVHEREASRLGNGYAVAIQGFGDRLLQLTPIEDGWAAVGRADKYPPAAGVEVISSNARELRIRMPEAGPLVVWSRSGAPASETAGFHKLGDGLFLAELPAGDSVITREEAR